METVLLTEVAIGGSITRTTPTSLFRDCWIKACDEVEIEIFDDGMEKYDELIN